MDIFRPTWNETDRGVCVIANNIENQYDEVPYDYIVGLTRGGLFPAIILSHLWDIPMIAVNYSSVHGKGDNKNHQNALPAIHGDTAHSRTGVAATLPRLLITDDICDSGATLKEVTEYYEQQGHEVTSAVLHYKENALLTPDHYCWKIEEDSPWVVYPWETT